MIMKRIIYFLCLGLMVGMVACTSSEKEENQDQTQKNDTKSQNLSTDGNAVVRELPRAFPNPELDQKSIETFVNDEILLQVMEIGDITKVKKKVNKDGALVITWPRDDNPKEKMELTLSRGETFSGGMDNLREMAVGANKFFYDDIGDLGGYFDGGEEKGDFYFPVGGHIYKLGLPNFSPMELRAEKGRQLALLIWENNR
jgi:hypothetical protein